MSELYKHIEFIIINISKETINNEKEERVV